MIRRFTNPLAAGVVLALFWGLLIATAWNKSVTNDEIVHATAGYTYWKFNDFRIDPENGNLPQRIAGLPLLGYSFPPTTSENWLNPSQWELADEWFHHMGIDVQGLLRRGRAAAALQAVALAALVWVISRRIFGPVGAMLSLVCCVMNPTILANGSLMTSDVAAALFFLAATWSWWLLLERRTAVRFAASVLATAGLFASKSSAILIIPILLALAAVHFFDRGQPGSRRRRFVTLLTLAGFQSVLCYAALWGFYGFRYSALAPGEPAAAGSRPLWTRAETAPSVASLIEELNLPASKLRRAREVIVERSAPLFGWANESEEALTQMRQEGLISGADVATIRRRRTQENPDRMTAAIAFLARHRLLPEAYLAGSLHAWRFGQMRAAFLDGVHYFGGTLWFFPYTFAVKTPLAFLGLLLLAGLAQRGWWRRRDLIPLVGLFLFYGAALLASRLNIGHRHMLTLYPPLFIFAGAAGAWLESAARSRASQATPLHGAGNRSWAPQATPLHGPGNRSRATAALAVLVLIGVQIAETAWRFPDYLAYFNGIVAPGRGYRRLIDSSLDWGQDLPGVRKYIDEHPRGKPYLLSYFGNADPRTYGIEAVYLPTTPGRFRADRKPVIFEPVAAAEPGADVIDGLKRRHPQHDYIRVANVNGGWFAVFFLPRERWRLPAGSYLISATNLQAKYGEHEEAGYQQQLSVARLFLDPGAPGDVSIVRNFRIEDWRDFLNAFEVARQQRLQAFLRQYTPDDQIGGSILVFNVSEADLARALDGPAPFGSDYLGKTLGGKE